jgi:RND family efflux transporter MFP subunit
MKSRFILIVLAAAAVLAVLFLAVRPRIGPGGAPAGRALARTSVGVTVARSAPATREFTLPGTLQAFIDTAIHARTSGYLGKWYVDIGDRVKEGQKLATIEAPEVDQELNQARANLLQARANLSLAQITAARWKSLGEQNAVSQQDVDQRSADFEARKADVAAAEANVQRLEQLQGFETVSAPFDGVISARRIDIGDLITAGAGPELFHLAQSDVLRAYVNVPQSYVPDVRQGAPVDVLVAEFPKKAFQGHVVRYAGALDPASRTLLVEVRIPNSTGELFAGMFCQLRFRLATAAPAILIPSNDAIIRAEGTLVDTVTDSGAIHIQKVTLGRDFGTRIEVLEGLADGQRVVDNPSDALTEGQPVEVVEPGGNDANSH